ncbi:heavy-metal-associated domain-containing protein [Sporosalibacterium faouarense]|uniref:heavy-metal-associated domain-containing protein n=1 Tax=Sporosalibacterium faouarense TaxID=516123 RepID=UPI00141C9709|nr:heavy-metal-associated domain-containing protein [Sporosalibacterium faouarense]MTI48848.1 heavy-metal-associated domain-containing protein [Bacillota bacterium]
MKKLVFIKGMSCQHCVMAVKGALGEVDGIKSVDVDLESGSATLNVDNVSDDTIKNAIEEAGYEVIEVK